MARIFAFEGENNRTLEWMPLDVRRKLDLAGLRLSLAPWQRLTHEQREQLVAAEGAAFVALVVELVPDVPRIEPTAPWRDEEAFAMIAERARALSIPIDSARLHELDDAGRYALFRLADPKKSEEKFRAAVAELGV